MTPIIVDEYLRVIDGCASLLAAKSLGLSYVPVIRLHHLNPAQERALRLALNKSPDGASWNYPELKIEFEEIKGLDCEFDLSFTGFEMGEIDLVMGDPDPPPEPPVPLPERDSPAFTQFGDIFELGEHIVACADARDEEAYNTVLAGGECDLTLTDPPYNVSIPGNVSGKGLHKHPEFLMASGEMSEGEFSAFLLLVMTLINQFAKAGALHFLFMDWRHMDGLIGIGREVFTSLENFCVWTKTNAGMGSLYRSQHEMIALFKTGTARHTNNVQLGKYGRNRTNVWSYPGVSSFGSDRDEALAMHPTVKPLALVRDAILDVSNRGDRVLDPFLGSGTTLIACEETGRRCAGIEIDPHYVDVIIRRWQSHTGKAARLVGTGMTFDALCIERQGGEVGDER